MIKTTLGIFAALFVSGAAHAGPWYSEQAYLTCNPDVVQALRNGQIPSAYEHYLQFGQFENRVTDGSCASAVRPGRGGPGGPGWDNGGRGPGRGDPGWDGGRGPGRGGPGWDDGRGPGRGGPGWGGGGRGPGRGGPGYGFDEREYLRCNPDVARAVRNGQMESGWAHYQVFGRRENRRLSC